MVIACIDGLNLALRTGSGIATYGRTLITALEGNEVRTQILYGPLAPVGRDAVLDEAIIAGEAVAPSKSGRFRRIAAEYLSPLGRTATPVVPSGRIAWSPDVAATPAGHRAWANERLYKTAGKAFGRYGAMTPVEFGATSEMPRPDVCHWTAPMPIWGKGAANLYTFHDLIPLTLPASTRDDKRHWLNIARAAATRADHIMAVSESTRRDLVSLLGVEPDRITVTGQSFAIPTSALARSDSEIADELDAAFGLEWKGYLLHYGAIEPKKNLGRIVEAYLGSGVKTPLVLVGANGWLADEQTNLLKQSRAAGGSGRILQLDYLPADVLMALVRGARATLFPSLSEGFGLPVLESMALATAVLTSTTGSLPEIAGDCALLVDPYDVTAVRAGLVKMDSDGDLRAELVQRGIRRAETFSPAAYADKIGALYRRLGLA